MNTARRVDQVVFGTRATEEGFDRMVREFHGTLVAYVRRRIANPDDAEDLVQDIFLRLYAGGWQPDWERSVSSWLYRITRNAIVDYYRSQRESVALPEDLAASGDAAPEVLSEIACCVRPMIRSLPDLYRDALLAVEVDSLAVSEVATKFGLTLAGAKSRIQRGRRLLAATIHACCRPEYGLEGKLRGFETARGCGGGTDAACSCAP